MTVRIKIKLVVNYNEEIKSSQYSKDDSNLLLLQNSLNRNNERIKEPNKIGKLVSLLVKIKNSEEVKKYCVDKLGNDFMQKLLSEKVSTNYIEKVVSLVDEYFLIFSHGKIEEIKFKVNYKNQVEL